MTKELRKRKVKATSKSQTAVENRTHTTQTKGWSNTNLTALTLLAIGGIYLIGSSGNGVQTLLKRGVISSSYSCDPTVCRPQNNCMCPSTSPPGGLSISNTPQFILYTSDDAVSIETLSIAYNQIAEKHKNPNGCPITAAWMVSTMWTDYHMLQTLYAAGMEIADHVT
jgi:hypothetical protein